jgi:5-methyltetrahydropteroyltriglutamate--homocysteine methyltransferase
MKSLVKAGAKYLQFEDLGAWLPLFTGNKDDYTWIKDVVAQCCDGVDATIGWHFCFGNAWGNDILSASFPEGYQTVLPYFFDTPGIDGFVLDYANRDMAGIEFMKNLPKDKHLQVGVVDIRTNAMETPAQIVARIKKVLAAVPADRLILSTDCGMKPLARMVAKQKLRALSQAPRSACRVGRRKSARAGMAGAAFRDRRETGRASTGNNATIWPTRKSLR